MRTPPIGAITDTQVFNTGLLAAVAGSGEGMAADA